MPLMWLRAHAESARELQAEEAFRLAEIVSVGAAKMGKTEMNKVVSRWRGEMDASGGEHRLKTAGDVAAAARIMGMGVRTVEPR